jgi:hypothetical protein
MASRLGIAGGFSLGAGILATYLEASNHSACTSDLGQLGQAISQNVAHQCRMDNGVFYVGIVAAVVGVIMVVGAVAQAQHRPSGRYRPQTNQAPSFHLPSPGWYADPGGSASPRWWDGYQWGALSTARPPPPPVS